MEIESYRLLFNDLNELSKKLNYCSNLVRFDEFVDFYEYLKTHEPNILYKDDNYYYLDNLKKRLKDFASEYTRTTSSGYLKEKKKSIPVIPENVLDMMTSILIYQRSIIPKIKPPVEKQLFTLEDIKKSTNESLKEYLEPLALKLTDLPTTVRTGVKLAYQDIYAKDENIEALTEEERSKAAQARIREDKARKSQNKLGK